MKNRKLIQLPHNSHQFSTYVIWAWVKIIEDPYMT